MTPVLANASQDPLNEEGRLIGKNYNFVGPAPSGAPAHVQPAVKVKRKVAKNSADIHALLQKERENIQMLYQQVLQLQLKISRHQELIIWQQRQRMQSELHLDADTKQTPDSCHVNSMESLSQKQGNTNPQSHSRAAQAKPRLAYRARKKRKGERSDKPKRPLTAYNIFFQHERALMLGLIDDGIEDASLDHEGPTSAQGDCEAARFSTTSRIDQTTINQSSMQHSCSPRKRVGFAEMAQRISQKWKALDKSTHEKYLRLASKDKNRYVAEKADYLKREKNLTTEN